MGEKDITQKNFESYNDVVADIFNGSLFDGEEYIKADSLVDAQPFSQYKADDGSLHEQERDVAKYCLDVNCNIRLALVGVENQIAIDFDMPLRVMGYDGISYRDEMNLDKIVVDALTGKKRRMRHKRYPVITLVLYFGEKPWKKPLCLYDVIDVPDKLKPFVNDFKLNIIDVPRLTPEQVKKYKGDFQIIADYFVQRNSGKEYVPPDKPIQHVDSMLKLMSVLTRDSRYSEWLAEKEGRLTKRDTIRRDIDTAIRASTTEAGFVAVMTEMGYSFKTRTDTGKRLKYPALKPPDAKGWFRFHTLGEGYNLDEVIDRVYKNRIKLYPFPDLAKPRIIRHGKVKNYKKHSSIYRLYLRYCYQLKIIKHRPTSVKRVSFLLREDVVKLDKYIQQTQILGKYHIK